MVNSLLVTQTRIPNAVMYFSYFLNFTLQTHSHNLCSFGADSFTEHYVCEVHPYECLLPQFTSMDTQSTGLFTLLLIGIWFLVLDIINNAALSTCVDMCMHFCLVGISERSCWVTGHIPTKSGEAFALLHSLTNAWYWQAFN